MKSQKYVVLIGLAGSAGMAAFSQNAHAATAAPTESTAAPTESTAAPTESTAAPAESTAAPAESTATPAESTATPAEAKAPSEPNAQGGLEDIVVTATRREERLQDIPVAVTAITANTINASGITDVRNLTQVVPGFTGNRVTSVIQPVIRAVGSSGLSVGDEANVATYIDGVYQGDPFSTSLELVEVERVEVLRGPQGTVFGRNATGGLINVITPDPSFNTRGRVALRLGRTRNNANEYDARAYLTGPLTETVAADFAGLYRKREGFVKDLVRGGGLGGSRVIDVRSKLLFEPSDSAKIILTGQYADQNSSMVANQPFLNNTVARNHPDVILPTGPWQASLNQRPVLNYERYNLSLHTHFDLGNVNLETSTGYLHTTGQQDGELDVTNIAVQAIFFPYKVEALSQEIRLLSAGRGPLQWILGAYAFRLDGEMKDIDIVTTTPGGVVHTVLGPEVKTTSYAGFAEGTYEIVDRLFLTLGARYTTEKREFKQFFSGQQLFEVDKTFNKFTYRAALRYTFAEDASVYASYGTGFKSGVYNAVGTSPAPANPETIKAWEVGLKADPLPWLRTNLALYYYDYRDLQAQTRSPTGMGYVLLNAANATVYGGELEVSAAATDDLTIRASTAYTHGEYDEFPFAQDFVPLPTGGNFATIGDAGGKRMIRAPRYTFQVGADWGHDVSGGRMLISGNLFHSGTVYYDYLNRTFQKPYSLASGEVSWTTPNEALRLMVWMRNITNAKVATSIRVGALSNEIVYEAPRMVGVGAEFKF